MFWYPSVNSASVSIVQFVKEKQTLMKIFLCFRNSELWLKYIKMPQIQLTGKETDSKGSYSL